VSPSAGLLVVLLIRRVVIYQIGTSDPELAVLAAKTVEQDVAGL
jgi:tRNA-dihydrouridine synthase